ncbi:hypothetical protein GF339_09680 [candidate division KSB3 bacterium]|uniref:Uncharacterized protein n=1 Tax=candidate division KSB3 bacterium TaxID=2044937 RepID=A0A9D5JVD7_9BACT|nr:hypothetical protein [candidate division KSB3 bacterium]MBD3324843.1 hypothetical protein [candidate division KSB3 bacterium]
MKTGRPRNFSNKPKSTSWATFFQRHDTQSCPSRLKYILMTARRLILLSFYFIIAYPPPLIAGDVTVVTDEYLWFSANVTEIAELETHKAEITPDPPLRELVYNRHFEQKGFPPPLEFLRPLKKGASPVARIEGQQIIFPRAGRQIPLNTSIVPSWADAATPYLLSTPGTDWVVAVYPYYFYQCKDNAYYTEVYSEQGELLSTFDTLPTHVSARNPYLLIAPEKSGCCDSLRWSVRFYNLHEGSVVDLSCPEGFCGDVLFTRLEEDGPFVVAQEILGAVSGIGVSLQTHIFIIGQDGALLASGKIIHAVRDSGLHKSMMPSSSPYAISNLMAIDPAPENNTWLIHFGAATERRTVSLVSIANDPPPAVVFLLSDGSSKGLVKTAAKTVGKLPLLGVSEPGQYVFSIFFENGRTNRRVTTLQPDEVNIITF